MTIEELKLKLDDAKHRFLIAREEIESLRQDIAESLCPLKVGDTVSIVDNGKEYDGVVEYINPATPPCEFLNPVAGVDTGWVVGGHRINKGTGEVGKWFFGINSLESKLVNGQWVLKKQGIEKFLPFI